MRITFFGATRTVTGSMMLIEHKEKKILMECGLFQGRRSESEELNRHFPFDPKSIDMVIISHAHIDHSGNLPNLVKQGFEGDIVATHATLDLLDLMLRDSGHIHEKDIEYLNKKLKKKNEPPKEPLYTVKDAEHALRHLKGYSYYSTVKIDDDLQFSFIEAGHILGSSQILFENKGRKILFTGDIGRDHMPIIRNPDNVSDVDVLITESTYGDRTHRNIKMSQDELKSIIEKTHAKRGNLVVPSFSVGRTQEILFDIYNLKRDNAIPQMKIFVDSPLSSNVTDVFKNHPECYDTEMMSLFNSKENPFEFDGLYYITDVEDSKQLNMLKEPSIIISSSGMCEAGRILHHLKHNITEKRNTILVTGFMAENTLGRRIAEREKKVKIFSEEFPLKADVYIMNEYSAHADKNDLLRHVKNSNPKKIFLVHGEAGQMDSFAKTLDLNGYKSVERPVRGEAHDFS
ncbi:MAG: MBL fold metallo-hydrolase RNA specificity domain-containing protein [bacterium]